MGSRDRKQLSSMLYSYYRLGHCLPDVSPEEKILAGVFLCNQLPSELLQYLKPLWNEKISAPLSEKLSVLGIEDAAASIFPWSSELSKGIEREEFAFSHLHQPDLFIRIRPGHEENVIGKLERERWQYEWLRPYCVRLPNRTKVDEMFDLNREIVVQDFSSQQIGEFMLRTGAWQPQTPLKTWDCCAGSGGKSILLHDLHPAVNLTVSDIRPSILQNLKTRFAEAGLKNYRSFTADLSVASSGPPERDYDLIVADVPCSGSGTWGRTPESLCFFNPAAIESFRVLQQKIISNVAGYLKKGGVLIYITCSVFERENEWVADMIQREIGLRLLDRQLFAGYPFRADSMFAGSFVAN